jgi:hypothetical protein
MALSSRHVEATSRGTLERRAGKRASVSVKGKLFFPNHRYEEDCTVLDLSPDGAGVKASCSVPIGAPVVLYVDGLGRFDGILSQRNRLRVGLKFRQTAERRAKVAEKLAEFLRHGKVDPTAARARGRIEPGTALHNFTLQSGQSVECEVIDVALSGASFRTTSRPPVGEKIAFGRTVAVVVRHTASGFAAQFTGDTLPDPAADELPPLV